MALFDGFSIIQPGILTFQLVNEDGRDEAKDQVADIQLYIVFER